MIRVGVVGVGKMGLSHLSIINTHPNVQVVGICDASSYVLGVLARYTAFPTFSTYRALIEQAQPDAVIIATPTGTHAEISRYALQRGIHVFVEKPFCLTVEDGRELVALAANTKLVNQVGYHYRFVGAFQEVKRLLERGVIGNVHNFRIEAYGPVVLQPRGTTWRASKTEGGGCLYDYASHAANLITHFFGSPTGVGGTVLQQIFSKDVEDEVYATLYFPGSTTGQLCVNWSDATNRKMSMRVEIWGANGKISADRQECQVYLRSGSFPDLCLAAGWNIRYATELTHPVRYYVRGEEYSAQIDYFLDCIGTSSRENMNSFASALETDIVLDMLLRDAELGPRTTPKDMTDLSSEREGNLRKILGCLLGRNPRAPRVS